MPHRILLTKAVPWLHFQRDAATAEPARRGQRCGVLGCFRADLARRRELLRVTGPGGETDPQVVRTNGLGHRGRGVGRSAQGSLELPAVHPPPWIRILGLAILLAATAFTLWARLALGTMWSGAPTVKQEH